MTNLTPSAAKLLATETPCLGSETSSPYSRLTFLPRMPPAALMSATARSTPFLICAPVAAFGPVIGLATPNLTCAAADPATVNAKPNAMPSVVILFIFIPPQPYWHVTRAEMLRHCPLWRQSDDLAIGGQLPAAVDQVTITFS